MPAVACEAFEPIFASAGALAFVNASAGAAALPALSNACAARQLPCPFVPLSPTLGDDT
jgi:hypothetical protein